MLIFLVAYNKFNVFVEYLMSQVVDLFGTTPGTDSDVCKVYLSNTTPDAELDLVKADLAEITAENGYTAGGETIDNNGVRSTTTVTFSGVSVQWTASGGTIGPFQYVVLYDDTHASDALIAWWDHGSSITLADGESFSVLFNGAAVGSRGDIFTLV